MFKICYFIIILFIFSHCSLDSKSGLWKNKKNVSDKKKITKINFDKELDFVIFKENIILYGKKSKFPDINK